LGEEVPSVEPSGPARSSWLRRLRHTPPGDLLRMRVTGRGDLARRLDRAGLPAELRRLVAEVVGKARLWPGERAAIAGELIERFRAGLDSGKDAARLAADFGPPGRAARALGRARRRRRPLAWRITWRAAQAAVVLLALAVGVYVAATVRLLSARPGAASGASAVARAAAPDLPSGERAWPLYRQALVELGRPPPPLIWPAPSPADPAWYEAARMLEERRGAVALLRQAAAMPASGYVVGDEVDPFDRALWPQGSGGARAEGLAGAVRVSLLPYLAEMRRLAALVCFDALRAAAAGDAATVTDDLLAAIGIAAHAREQPFVQNDLVAGGSVALAARTLGAVLADRPDLLSDAQLGALAHRFWAVPFQLRLDGERALIEDFMRQAYSNDGAGGGRLTARGLELMDAGGALAPLASLLAAGRRATLAESERWLLRLEAEAARPPWRRDPEGLERDLDACRASWLYRRRYMPVVLLLPAPAAALAELDAAAMDRDAACTAIALVIERRRRGAWAKRLDDLAPHALPAPPADCFGGAPLRYVLRDGRPLLYSVGPDRDDDGGRAADGDRPLWPAPRDEPVPLTAAPRR
jgi:hypothetical protein